MVEVAAIVLAAGRATRFAAGTAGASKLCAPLEGRPLVAHAVKAAASSRAAPVIVVTGHAAERVAAALVGCDVTLVHNAGYAEGMAGSIRTGVAALPPTVEAALILLGDMPRVAPATLDTLIEAFARERPEAAVPVHDGRRGNPVLVARALFPALLRLEGDAGARGILSDGATRVLPVAVTDPGIGVDVDTREALDALAPDQAASRTPTVAAGSAARSPAAKLSHSLKESRSSISRADSGAAKK